MSDLTPPCRPDPTLQTSEVLRNGGWDKQEEIHTFLRY